MEAIRKLKVECPYEILKIEDAKIFCKPNEHGSIYLKCLIDDSVNFKYSIEASTNDKICVYEEIEENTDLSNNENTGNEEKRIIIFNGIIENVKTTNINGIYYLELEGSSTSSLLDMEKRTRSFQDINMSYDDLINEILKNYKGYGFTQCMSQPMSIEKPLFQYKETDYEFLKRIGSHLGLEIICDVVNTNNIIYFGKPSLKFHALNNEINYKAHKDLEKYHKVLALGMDLHDTDFFYYEVILREKMNIGDLIKFKERDFYVNQYYGQIHNRELIYKYRLCRKKGIWQEKIYNEKLKGISIEGKVLAVDGEKVKLHLNIDESQEISKASWFKYAPPTGNIMYAMPIVGESVMLYFPNKYDEPIVTGCVRKNGSSCSKISNTNNRYFSTESGNNLDILPGAINFYRSGMNVNLNDENGINISSSGNLSLGASGGISLSGGSVSISGSNKVVVQKSKSSYISLEGECYNQSNEVYENGSCRETYEPFTDDDPQNGVAEALAEQMKMNEAALLAATDGANAVSSSTDDSKTDGTLDIAVDDYGKFAEDGEEAYKKAKPTEQLVGSVVADECVELIIEPLKWIPMGARWFGEKTGLGDENTYKNNTECIERLTELQEGVHKFFKNLSGDERTFEGISAIYENALAVSGGISLIIGATKGSIALSKSKKVKELLELLKGTKVCSKTADKIDDFEKWLNRIVKPNEVEAEKLSDVEKTIENVTNEGNNIAEEVSKAPKVADEVETSKINNGEVSKGARDPKTLKFSEMPEEEITKVVNKYREKSPIEIPETAKIKAQSKDGYEQISYKWNDGTYKYESRWHTRTPGAPEEQGNTWVIQRTKPGNGGTRPTTEFKIGEDEWIPGYKWYDAIGARKAGTATPEQISILDRGHWKE